MPKRTSVAVVGSYNIDQTIRVPRIPAAGETIIGSGFTSGSGGKGANQALAAARAGAAVTFVARVGRDPVTEAAFADLAGEGVCTEHVFRDPKEATGRAWIVVDTGGENAIVVAPGANARLLPGDIEAAAEAIEAAEVLLLQLEIPMETVVAAARIAHGAGTTVILNPAPARALGPELLRYVDIITPNVIEAEMITGIRPGDDAALAAVSRRLREMGGRDSLITLGARGVFVSRDGGTCRVPAYPVEAVDTTGAGDVFTGCLAAFLPGRGDLCEAARLAAAAAAISVTRPGAQSAVPFLTEIEAFSHTPPGTGGLASEGEREVPTSGLK